MRSLPSVIVRLIMSLVSSGILYTGRESYQVRYLLPVTTRIGRHAKCGCDFAHATFVQGSTRYDGRDWAVVTACLYMCVLLQLRLRLEYSRYNPPGHHISSMLQPEIVMSIKSVHRGHCRRHLSELPIVQYSPRSSFVCSSHYTGTYVDGIHHHAHARARFACPDSDKFKMTCDSRLSRGQVDYFYAYNFIQLTTDNDEFLAGSGYKDTVAENPKCGGTVAETKAVLAAAKVSQLRCGQIQRSQLMRGKIQEVVQWYEEHRMKVLLEVPAFGTVCTRSFGGEEPEADL